ncbi:hypothetical protein P171DRAFT_429861 [Karstenula rhodostoma CBS 690.94]|uniref:Uncharacterized protein n=1 Tax=Karstenula rhodostoma CBS 690.94 TaxID=1392251 RepID=A0A9P4UE99_9PLEO|nr:hypothetical protein P171DRAFT_429861 [Karstenula rhodostoma CBS 690.94]
MRSCIVSSSAADERELQSSVPEIPRDLSTECFQLSTSVANFSFAYVLGFTHQHRGRLRHWHCHRSVYHRDNNPLLVADGLVDLYQEVHVATDLYAQSLNAAMEAFINPWTELKPITLSSAEYVRIASTLSILRIFYQLQLKCSTQEDIMPTSRAFLTHLDQWEIKQLAALDEFLLNVGYGRLSAVYHRLDAKYSDWKALSNQSTYVQRYFRTLKFSVTQEEPSSITPISIMQAVRPGLHGQAFQLPLPPQWAGTIAEALSRMLKEDTVSRCPSRTFGWFLYDCSMYQWDWYPCFVDLGMFFWDYRRLEDWGILHQPTYDSMLSKFKAHLEGASKRGPMPLPRLHPCAHYSEKQKVEIIVRWTRSPIQCSIEEWLWQHYAVDHYSQSPLTADHSNFNVRSFNYNIQCNEDVEKSCFNPRGCKFHSPY